MKTIALCLLATIAAPLTHAQFAVVDVQAIAQLLQQVRMLGQQLATARDQLSQAQNEFQSMTGNRGMERLLNGVARNYLPADWAGINDVLRGNNVNPNYDAVTRELQAAVRGLSVLSARQLAPLPQSMQNQVSAMRTSTALLQVLTRQALVTSSERFSALQQLIEAIRGATDQKAVLDLQARIGVEQGMLQNEQTKLQALYRAAEAERWANLQLEHEQAFAAQGQFATRFRPAP
jgi:type IV secretion system protein VirB5